MAALLGLFWRLLREGRLKVARGRSWQPEIGMEHASRGRRSGNKGVGARWRGRFRIFSARHCSRTKVSHAENSGMTMLFFSWRLLRCRRGILSHPLERTARGVLVFLGDAVAVCFEGCCGSICWPGGRPATHAATGAAARGALIFCFRDCFTRSREDGARGFGFLFFSWALLPCRACVDHGSGRRPALRRGRRGI